MKGFDYFDRNRDQEVFRVNKDGQEVDTEIMSGTVTIDGALAAKESVTQDFTLFQNNPNPFSENTKIVRRAKFLKN